MSDQPDKEQPNHKAALEIEKLRAELAKLAIETEILRRGWWRHGPHLAPILQATVVIFVTCAGTYTAIQTNVFGTRRERAEIETFKAQQAADSAKRDLAELTSRKSQLSRANAQLDQTNTSLKEQNAEMAKDIKDLQSALRKTTATNSLLKGENVANLGVRARLQERLEREQARVMELYNKIETTSRGRWNPNDVVNLKIVFVFPDGDHPVPLSSIEVVDEHRKNAVALQTDATGVAKWQLNEDDVASEILKLTVRLQGVADAMVEIPQGTINVVVRLQRPAPHLIQTKPGLP